MTLKQAIVQLMTHVHEFEYEDRGYDYNVCISCGWNTKENRGNDANADHNPGCAFKQALVTIEQFFENSNDT